MTARLALSPDQIEERWPRCKASVQAGNVYTLITGRLVGRTTEGSPRYDIRSDDGTLHVNVPAAHVRIEP